MSTQRRTITSSRKQLARAMQKTRERSRRITRSRRTVVAMVCAQERKKPDVFENLEENYVDFMNMYMIRNNNMDQNWLKRNRKTSSPLRCPENNC